jgi:hypothetical protein
VIKKLEKANMHNHERSEIGPNEKNGKVTPVMGIKWFKFDKM